MGKKKITYLYLNARFSCSIKQRGNPPNKFIIVFKYFQFMEVFLFSET